jgi:hypothetical protein
MSVYNSQIIVIDTLFIKETISFIFEQGVLLGFRYRTWSGSIIDSKEAVEYVLCINEYGFHNIFVDYQDTDFDLLVTGDKESPLYISMNPPNSCWTVDSAGFNWIDNSRYGLLLLFLCKGLPIIDFYIESDIDHPPKPTDNNTIRIAGSFTSLCGNKKFAEILMHNIAQYNYSIESNSESLCIDVSPPIVLNHSNYKITLYFKEDILYITALEPYAMQVINNKVYVDIHFYVTFALSIIETCTIFTLSCNFNEEHGTHKN